MLRISDKIKEEVAGYKAQVAAFKSGELDETRFKAYRVPMGIYEERTNNSYMVRTRIPSGAFTVDQFKKIHQLAKDYSHGKIHLTTRQGIQFHKVALEDTIKIMDGLLEVGIMCRGTGGNTPRNIANAPLSGVEKGEIFDTLPFALSAIEHLLEADGIFALPRKYKLAFSSSETDGGLTKLSDIGFLAVNIDGKEGFRVYAGGGLGSAPRPSIVIREFIEKDEYLDYVFGMKKFFEEFGDRKNRAKARVRHILHRLGEEEFSKKLDEFVDEVKRANKYDGNHYKTYPVEHNSKEGSTAYTGNHRLVTESKIKNRYQTYIQPKNGYFNCDDIELLIKAIDQTGEELSLRVGGNQGIYIREIDGANVDIVLDAIKKIVSTDSIDEGVACAGAATCKLGLCLSQGLSQGISDRFAGESKEVKNYLPKTYISGCPNSCGKHPLAKIGFFGKAKKNDGHLVPMYCVVLGADLTSKTATLATPYKDIPAKAIPDFLVDLSKLNKGQDFDQFLVEKDTEIRDLLEKYSYIPELSENADFYSDWGNNKAFSLKGMGSGECSIGVLDVVREDIATAKSIYETYEGSKKDDVLFDAAINALKSLLSLKGDGFKKNREIFDGFKKHLIDEGYFKTETVNLLTTLQDYKLGDVDSLESVAGEVKELIKRVDEMYKGLNSKLEFTTPKIDDSKTSVVENKDEKSNDEIVDLRGVKCPINFVKAKVELSKIQSGEEIEFLLDDGAPINNVPGSIKKEGHEVLEIDDNYEGYNRLKVRKK